MADQALIQRVPVEGQSWSRFKATDSGVAAANRILDRAMQEAPEAAQYLYATKTTVNAKSFDALLEDVYERYPQFATRSIFRRRA